jgi:hypothetical protein
MGYLVGVTQSKEYAVVSASRSESHTVGVRLRLLWYRGYPTTKLVEQFAGYLQLEDVDLGPYRALLCRLMYALEPSGSVGQRSSSRRM